MNYHHLSYFRAVAREGTLTRAAQQLRIAPSALSTQIRQLEDQFNTPLFTREGRGLQLTEAGRVALAYADRIFAEGSELEALLLNGRAAASPLRVGAVATLSRNFQRSFVRPLIRDAATRLRLSSGSLPELLGLLEAHELDVVLANRPAEGDDAAQFRSHRLARQPVSIVSSSPPPRFRYPADLHGRAMILPGSAHALRSEFDARCERAGIRPLVVAEVDDMATLRLIALDSTALVLVPSVVVRDELREGSLAEVHRLRSISEQFFAITVDRRFVHPLLPGLLQRDEHELLDAFAEEQP